MGKIVNSTFVSIDGVINHMEAWHFGYVSDEPDAIALEQLQASEALLMGRHTYDAYASAWPQRDGGYADLINAIPKYVVSTTLDKADWNNTTVIKGDLVTEAAKLKEQDGDILMHGFGPVANTLITNGLLDVLHLWVHPRFAGVGGPGDLLLHEGNNTRLELLGTRTLTSGIVLLSYRVPAEAPGA
jgi:dihydrofolate reductase